MNKVFWDYFKHFGRLLEKIICSSLPANKNVPEEQIFWGTDPLGAPDLLISLKASKLFPRLNLYILH